MINLRILHPYTNQRFDEINEKLADPEIDGIVLPVGINDNARYNRYRNLVVYRQNEFLNGHHFDFKYGLVRLSDFIKEIDLQNKQVFLSFIGLFDNYGGGKLPIERLHYEVLRENISEINELTDNIVINNDLYYPILPIEGFFVKLKTEFPNIEYAYTNYNQDDDISMTMDSIVARNMGYEEIIKYINLKKQIYFPDFEAPCLYYKGSRMTIYNLLQYYYSEGRYASSNDLNFKDADITVISRENKSKILEMTLKRGNLWD